MNKSKLLDEIDKLNREYWTQVEAVKEKYRIKLKAISSWKGARSKLAIMEAKMIKLREDYKS